jgi:transcription antitermination factor NusG
MLNWDQKQGGSYPDGLLMVNFGKFPGYLFVRNDLNDWAHINSIRTLGVVRILGIKGQRRPVPEDTPPAF